MVDAAVERGEIRPELSFEQIRAIIIGPLFLTCVHDAVRMSDDECEALVAVVCRALG
jgi:hypothetical protein